MRRTGAGDSEDWGRGQWGGLGQWTVKRTGVHEEKRNARQKSEDWDMLSKVCTHP